MWLHALYSASTGEHSKSTHGDRSRWMESFSAVFSQFLLLLSQLFARFWTFKNMMSFETFHVSRNSNHCMLIIFYLPAWKRKKKREESHLCSTLQKLNNKQVLKTSWQVSIISLISAVRMSSGHEELQQKALVALHPRECFSAWKEAAQGAGVKTRVLFFSIFFLL